jgi:hypothetical protein
MMSWKGFKTEKKKKGVAYIMDIPWITNLLLLRIRKEVDLRTFASLYGRKEYGIETNFAITQASFGTVEDLGPMNWPVMDGVAEDALHHIPAKTFALRRVRPGILTKRLDVTMILGELHPRALLGDHLTSGRLSPLPLTCTTNGLTVGV